ncbi:electron transporter RnfD [Rufibacter immobilis]|uniref:Electron transporter RnfD n=1 Tax=Rufibacter immobilis TaxID=1348778 RepID=A0A3M9N3T2_9BACT|nr:SGNH/GDSL hydrolase family protein [Rufibacter immobilis]RNI32462.1 electron transporter RnfD [Rufibacter immobilis]
MRQRLFFSVFAFLFVFSASRCTSPKQLLVQPQHDQVMYMGRVGKPSAQTAELYWSGTSVKLNFEGTGVQARLKDDTGNSYYNVILDGDTVSVIRPDTAAKLFTLGSQLKPGKHTVELFKRTEWDKGTTTFYGFELPQGAKVLPASAKPKRSIEFYGNSITAGYAVHDYSGKDSWEGLNTDNYVSYAALTARYFNADYTCVCKSGIGITVSWGPIIMPEIYDRLNPSDASSRWDFTQKQPDVVVINLFQNDSWLVNRPEHEQFKRRFGTEKPTEQDLVTAYQNFVKGIRAKYPQAHIIAALGNMDITRAGSPWPGYVEKAVAGLQDKKIHTLFAPYKNTPGHPRREEQQAMAQLLIGFIEKNIEW